MRLGFNSEGESLAWDSQIDQEEMNVAKFFFLLFFFLSLLLSLLSFLFLLLGFRLLSSSVFFFFKLSSSWDCRRALLSEVES